MNPESVAHSHALFQALLPFSPILIFFAIVTVADVILKLRLAWLEHQIDRLDAEAPKLLVEQLLARRAAIDDSYWFDPQGHSHFCDPPSTDHHDD